MGKTGGLVGEKHSAMTGDEIVALAKKHTLFEWSAQASVDPIPVARAEGIYFFTPEGKRFIDFNSQLMCVNAGHGNARIIKAIQDQAATLAYANPFMATEPRARLGARLAEIAPGDINVFFFTNGGSEANENAIKLARLATGRQKILARYRSYHGATAGSITLTGDPRRWPSEPGIPGVVHVLDPYHGIERGWDSADAALATLEEVIQLEGPQTIAAFISGNRNRNQRRSHPARRLPAGRPRSLHEVRVLMICDEVMSGFGRTGEWFAVNHWNVVPDILTMAKGLTSAYVQLGAVGMRQVVADQFKDKVFASGLTYNSHPLACAAALAAIETYEEEKLIENARRMGAVMTDLHADLARRHPSVGVFRSLGLFGIVELVRNRKTRAPLAPFNGTSEAMKALAKFFRDEGLYTFVRWNTFFTNPPLSINEIEMRQAFAIIDKGLEITDRYVES